MWSQAFPLWVQAERSRLFHERSLVIFFLQNWVKTHKGNNFTHRIHDFGKWGYFWPQLRGFWMINKRLHSWAQHWALSSLWRKKVELRWFTIFGRLLTHCQKHCFKKQELQHESTIVNIVLSVLGLFAHSPQGLRKKTKVQLYLQNNLLYATEVKLFHFLFIFEREFSTWTDGAGKTHWCSLKQQEHAALICLRKLLVCFSRHIKSVASHAQHCHIPSLCHSSLLHHLISLFSSKTGGERKGYYAYYCYCLVLGTVTEGNTHLLIKPRKKILN